MQNIFRITLLVVSVIFLFLMPIQLPEELGTGDFRPYWSSSFLLAHGQDFSDIENLDFVERTQTGWKESYTMYAWFAPTGNLILLPYTFIPFPQATYYWLLTNILVLSSCAILIWQNKKNIWLAFVAIFLFVPAISSITVGQINTLVLLGLILFIFFNKTNQEWAMGTSLILTTIKAHLVILTLPLLLLDMLRQKKWRALTGLALISLLCVFILFMFYPAWYISFWKLLSSGLTDFRETPTLSGLLTFFQKPYYGKIVWMGALFISLLLYWRYGKTWNQRTMIDAALLIGTMVSPVGWSYDHIILLLPILSILEWVANGLIAKKNSVLIFVALFTLNACIYIQRVLDVNDLWYFWVPPALSLIYIFAKNKISKSSPPSSAN